MVGTLTVYEALRGISAYPIPMHTLDWVVLHRGLAPDALVTKEDTERPSYQLARADLFAFLSKAPNVSQGGQSYSFTAAERREMQKQANAIYEANGEEDSILQDDYGTAYGYKGNRL